MATARDKALQEISKLSPEARAYLTALAKKSNSMNQRSMGSGDEYVKGQIRASKGTPKRVQKAAPKKAAGSASKSAAARGVATSRAATKPVKRVASSSSGSRGGSQTAQQRQMSAMERGRSGSYPRSTSRAGSRRTPSQFEKTYIAPFQRAGKKMWDLLDG